MLMDNLVVDRFCAVLWRGIAAGLPYVPNTSQHAESSWLMDHELVPGYLPREPEYALVRFS